jgi:hypothetical protein
MRTSLTRAAGAVSIIMLLAWLALPITAASAETAKNVRNSDEAWFLNNKEPLTNIPEGDPTCDLPTGCNASGNATRSNPHPEGVLVVASNAGEPDAQAYFTFDTFDLGFDIDITGGTVTLPVARDPDARNVRAEAAQMVACLVTGYVPAGTDAGSYEDRPEWDENTCVEVKQTAGAPEPTYSVDLERFGKAWASGTENRGITLMVDPSIEAPAPDQTWRVAFNSARRSDQKTAEEKTKPKESRVAYPAITSTLQYTVAELPCYTNCDGDDGDDGGSGGNGTDDGGTTTPPADDGGTTTPSTDTGTGTDTSGGFDNSGTPGTGTVTPPSGETGGTTTPPVTPPVAAGQGGDVASPTVPTGAPAPPGTSAAVWVMPVLALAIAGAMAWSLLQPVELAGQREGAVSRLMRTRRLSNAPTQP